MAVKKLNYELAMNQASKLVSAAAVYEEAANDVQAQLQKVYENWTGEAADQWTTLMVNWALDCRKRAEELKGVASKVRRDANLLKTIDESGQTNGGRGF